MYIHIVFGSTVYASFKMLYMYMYAIVFLSWGATVLLRLSIIPKQQPSSENVKVYKKILQQFSKSQRRCAHTWTESLRPFAKLLITAESWMLHVNLYLCHTNDEITYRQPIFFAHSIFYHFLFLSKRFLKRYKQFTQVPYNYKNHRKHSAKVKPI